LEHGGQLPHESQQKLGFYGVEMIPSQAMADEHREFQYTSCSVEQTSRGLTTNARVLTPWALKDGLGTREVCLQEHDVEAWLQKLCQGKQVFENVLISTTNPSTGSADGANEGLAIISLEVRLDDSFRELTGEWLLSSDTAFHVVQVCRKSKGPVRANVVLVLDESCALNGKPYCYQPVKQLATGSSGLVKEVVALGSPDDGERFAAKILKRKALKEADTKHVFTLNREFAFLKQLNHPNIIRVRECVSSSNGLIHTMVLPLAAGSLSDLIGRGEDIKHSWVQRFAWQLLRALAHCHSKDIVHSDVKPANILLYSKANKSYELKLTDFGVSFAGRTSQGGVRVFRGTIAYMAPEMLFTKGTLVEKVASN